MTRREDDVREIEAFESSAGVPPEESFLASGRAEAEVRAYATLCSDWNGFAASVEDTLAGTIPRYESPCVSYETPRVLLDLGLENRPITFGQGHIARALEPFDEGRHQHGLTVEQIRRVGMRLLDPCAVMRIENEGEPGIAVLLPELGPLGRPLYAPIKLSAKSILPYQPRERDVYHILSIYGMYELFAEPARLRAACAARGGLGEERMVRSQLDRALMRGDLLYVNSGLLAETAEKAGYAMPAAYEHLDGQVSPADCARAWLERIGRGRGHAGRH